MKSVLKKSSPCPCGSAATYGDCCRAAVEGEREAPTAEALMRSRYVAFVIGAVDHLVRTLHADHPDRTLGEVGLRAGLQDAKHERRLLGLRVLEAREPAHASAGATAEVLFFARAFQKGRDVSFVELSEFTHDGVGWRYRDGVLLMAPDGVADGVRVDALTIAEFRKHCGE